MKLHYLIFPIAVIASGCSVTPHVNDVPAAQKTASAICASTGAALQAMVVAGATGAIAKVKPEAVLLAPVCAQKKPTEAITAAQSEAYTKIINAAAPYLGGVQ